MHPSWLSRSWWRTLELEEWLWLGLCYTSLGLLLLKLSGVLLLSWWWIVLPVAIPFLALGILLTVIVVLKGIEVATR